MTILDRRLASEWELLLNLADRNPARINSMRLDGATLSLHLHGPAAAPACPNERASLISTHAIRVEFPVHFPAVPMEMFLAIPVFHPNVHPETGFVCLWDRHRVSNTIEHALHKTVAMLCGELRNPLPLHVMQPAAEKHPVRTDAMPLLGVIYDPGPVYSTPVVSRRQRLQ